LIVVAIVHPLLHREGHQVPGAVPGLQCLPSKPECTPGNNGRVVRRSFDEGLLERVRAYRETEPYRNALRKRKVWVEPMFAEAKEWHRMRRFRLRRLWRVNVEALVIAAGQNVKRLLTFWGRGPRRLAQSQALRPGAPTPSANGRLLGSLRRRRSTPLSRVFQHAGGFWEVDIRCPA
jgi:hypothetical protein